MSTEEKEFYQKVQETEGASDELKAEIKQLSWVVDDLKEQVFILSL